MADFIITTTNNIEYGVVKKYIDVISENIVIGANIFSDFAASLTDFFGGTSGSYEKKIEFITSMSKIKLTNKAIQLGANAILGYKIDVDEVSGQNKSMFMISAIGTAVYVEYPKDIESKIAGNAVITSKMVDIIMRKQNITDRVNNGEFLNNEDFVFLQQNPITDDDFLVKLIKNIGALEDLYTTITPQIANYIWCINNIIPKKANVIFNAINGSTKKVKLAVADIAERANILNTEYILKNIDNDTNYCISLLKPKKDFYTKEDIQELRQVITVIDNMPNVGSIVTDKGLFGKTSEKFVCRCGKKNAIENEYCENCGSNIKGFIKDQIDVIEEKKILLKILENIH